ncbi:MULTISPECIES: hypothetical protein [Marivita]|jgi:hypothetical protein|nr:MULTISPECIES: hypothetical protein [Marivita]MCR9168205.1 hypothetical protein [Paracoccaceae bacterium]MBM2323030.1 hypothetical protein [Marivita cryptomonadis]MBM2342196.1 hypothetical protein [Marivita cryptomonadis]MBM2346861.1 hypothetical protein [Marivita cryptomonadis]MBM2366049.1 hypothetical protein [Marivita cryptomonadis]
MALSAKERKQKQLERERQAMARMKDATYPFLKTPFYKHLEKDGNWSSVELCFGLLGIEPPVFEDDRGPEEFADSACFATDEDLIEAFQSSEKSIGRAEVMVGVLLDAAMELANIINTYKSEELKKCREELERSDLSEPERRREALETSAQLARLQDELDKNVRRTFKTWTVKLL